MVCGILQVNFKNAYIQVDNHIEDDFMKKELRPIVHVRCTSTITSKPEGVIDLFSAKPGIKAKFFTRRGLIHISEAEEWFVWANKLRANDQKEDSGYLLPTNLDSFDYPTGKAILGFLKAKLKLSEKKCKELCKDRPETYPNDWAKRAGAIPIIDMDNFLKCFEENPDRVEIIQALDNFVGKYLKQKA